MHGSCITYKYWHQPKKKSQIVEEGRWNNYITPTLKNTSIRQLTTLDFWKLRRSIEFEGRSPQTVYHCLSLLRRVLMKAVEWGGELRIYQVSEMYCQDLTTGGNDF